MAHPPVNRIREPGRSLMRRPFHDLVLYSLLDSRRTSRCATLLIGSMLLASAPAGAQNGSPGPRSDEQPSLMQTLSDDGLHDMENESWNVYGQFTYISSWKPSFPAAYTNLNGSINSLLPTAERSFTGTATLFLGVRLWSGAEAGPGAHIGAPVFPAQGPGRRHPEF
jgi:hypothetical protein